MVFIFIISGYFISKIKDDKLKNFLFIILITFLYLSVVVTGERSNSIKATLVLSYFLG